MRTLQVVLLPTSASGVCVYVHGKSQSVCVLFIWLKARQQCNDNNNMRESRNDLNMCLYKYVKLAVART